MSSKLLKVGLEGAGYVNKSATPKRQIKYSLGFNGTFVVQAKAFFINTYHSENSALSEIIHQTNFRPQDIAVFDKGLSSRKKLEKLDLCNIRFVTRISASSIFEVCQELPFSTIINSEDQTVAVLCDSLVNCFDGNKKRIDTPFRVVTCRQKTTGEKLYFLTNMLDVKALEIAQIYRLRWDIEKFFKFIKQNLSFSHLLSRQEHSIQIVLYLTLIAASMIYLYKKLNVIDGFKIAKMRFLNELQTEIIKIIASQYQNNLSAIENLAGP